MTVTDARGATQTFTYNNRNLPAQISYSNFWQPLTSVTVGYDAAGNRTSMTDATGSRTYHYNQLSQLTSETRQFTGLSGNFMLSYEYNLAGNVKAFTDHAGSRVNYSFNSVGALTSVTGSGAHSIATYLSNIAYRAWGAIKDMDFGNGAHQHLNFNSSLRNTSLTLSDSSISATWNFDYYADGKLQKVTDNHNPIFDRAFDYDHIGRLQEVRTGNEARGGSTPDGPFKQSYTYDVWENTIARTYRLWSGSMQTDGGNFTNNQRQFWFYDDEGNVGTDFDASYGYDAAGRQNHFVSNATVGGWPTEHPQQPMMEILQTFDGDSKPAKKTTTNRWEEYLWGEVQIQQSVSTVYYLRSTVLGGKVVAELDETGYKRIGYVFAGGMQIATQHVWNPGYGYDVAMSTTSPATGSEYTVGGSSVGRKELDPLGADVTAPPTPMLIPEPVFYNPKFDEMLLQIEGGPSDEYEQNNADWAQMVTATIQTAQDRDRAEQLWQSGRRSEAMAILQRNPNVGIEYNVLVGRKVVKTGSYFGQAAADFLNGINIARDFGLLAPVTEASAGPSRSKLTRTTFHHQTFNDPEGKPMSTCFRKLLAPFFKASGEFRGLDLKDIRLHLGIPDFIQKRAAITVGAVVIGNDIYFNPRVYGEFTLDDLELMAHELVHVKQYRLHGMLGMPIDYFIHYLQNRRQGMSPEDAYQNNSMELEAAKEASLIRKVVKVIHGEYPCNSVGREP